LIRNYEIIIGLSCRHFFIFIGLPFPVRTTMVLQWYLLK